MLDLRRLRLLRELNERGTIAAVADALAFTPSAVSQQLTVLEAEAGVPLLTRAGRGVRLTMLTAYDYSMAHLLDAAGVDGLLVGDSPQFLARLRVGDRGGDELGKAGEALLSARC